MDSMDHRVKQALSWYDTASDKYQKALIELKLAKEKAKIDYPGANYMMAPLVKKWKELVRRYEEKLTRASATLYHVTMVMVALDKFEDAKEIILGDDGEDEEEASQ